MHLIPTQSRKRTALCGALWASVLLAVLATTSTGHAAPPVQQDGLPDGESFRIALGVLNRAGDGDPAGGAAAAGNERTFTIALSKLAGTPQPVKLSGVSAAYSFSVPVPALWRTKSVSLRLVGTASRSLIDTSQLVVTVNDTVIRQFPLAARGEGFSYELSIPVTALHPGFNTVRVEVAQHYTNNCEYPMAPQLWTQLNLEQSRLVVAAAPLDVKPSLNRLDTLFDKADWEDHPVVSIMSQQAPGEAMVQALGLVAQGIGQRYDYVPVSLLHQRLPQSPADLAATATPQAKGVVILGTLANLRPYLADMDIPAEHEAILALRPFPGNPARFMLILAAKTEAQLVDVARAFSVQQVPWPNSAWVSIKNLKLPEAEKLDARFGTPYAPAGAFPLRALGFQSTTYTGNDSPGSSIRFWNGSWQGRAQVRVHLSYGSGIGAQSALNIGTNGIMQGSIPLNNQDGGTYEKYAVSIPAGALKPGWNTLEFKPVMIPVNNGGECKPFFVGNLALTVYEDTTMQKFGGNVTNLPDLALLTGTGRFYSFGPSGQDMSVRLTDNSSTTLSAGMTLLAKIRQVYGGPLHRLHFGTMESPEAKSLFWIGPYGKLPVPVRDTFFKGLPSHFSVEAPMVKTSTFAVLEGAEWFSQALDLLGLNTAAPHYAIAQLDMSNTLHTSVFAKTAIDQGKELTVFTAEEGTVLQRGLEKLVQHGSWSQLQGSLAYWDLEGATVRTVALEDAAFSAYGLRGGLSLLISQYPWRSLIMLLILTALMVLLTRRALRAYRQKKNHENS